MTSTLMCISNSATSALFSGYLLLFNYSVAFKFMQLSKRKNPRHKKYTAIETHWLRQSSDFKTLFYRNFLSTTLKIDISQHNSTFPTNCMHKNRHFLFLLQYFMQHDMIVRYSAQHNWMLQLCAIFSIVSLERQEIYCFLYLSSLLCERWLTLILRLLNWRKCIVCNCNWT